MKILRVLALCLALSMLFAACGGGGEDESSDAAAPSAEPEPTEVASNEEFCDSVIGAEAAVLSASSGGDPGDLEGLLATVEETAPAELTDQVGVVVSTVREALDARDDSAFESKEFSDNEEAVDQWVADNCGYEAVHVSAVDYAFEGVPEALPAGPVTFHFSNDGEEMHEMLTVRYKDPSLTVKDLMELSDKEAQSKIDFLGASFGPPGTQDSESRDLAPGKYALLCFVSVGSTSPKAARNADGPPHVARGMWAEFTVE